MSLSTPVIPSPPDAGPCLRPLGLPVDRDLNAAPVEHVGKAQALVHHWALLVAAVDFCALAFGSGVSALTGANLSAPTVLVPCLTMGALLARGAYRRRPFRSSAFNDIRAVFANTAVGSMLTLSAIRMLGSANAAYPFLRLWACTLLAAAVGRVALDVAQRALRRRAETLQPVIIAGAGMVGHRIAERLLEHPEYGLLPVGFVDRGKAISGNTAKLPLLGSFGALPDLAQRLGARQIILAFSSTPDHELIPTMRQCESLGIEVSVVPRFFESLSDRRTLEHVGELPVVRMRRPDPKGAEFAFKHALDRALAGVLLVVLSPLLVAIAGAVRFSSPGPVLFRQRRVGRDGSAFDLLKFRSMRLGPSKGAAFAPAVGSAPGGVEGLDRRTRVGRFLRRSSLDELPQLFNVLRGEMSIVGPRPERPEYVARFDEELHRYSERHRVKSGITGWAQVCGLRGQTSIAKRVSWDNYYIENWSLWLDLKILALTFAAVFAEAE